MLEVLALDCYHTSVIPGSPAVILDFGAHVGSASLALHRIFPAVRIFCYEPSPATARFLRRNLSANGVTAEIHELVVAGRDGHAFLATDVAASSQAFLHSSGLKGTPVQVSSFDHAIEALGLGPVLLKLDCEGSEFGILEQSSRPSFLNVQTVLLEYHPPGDYGRVSAALERFGFDELWHDPDPIHKGLGLSCWFRPKPA